MGAINRLLKRWGYARLDEFGLLLTADDRIVATRPMVLDDGLGAPVVGWRDGDLAAIELAPWTRPADQRPSQPRAQRPASTAQRMRVPAASMPPASPAQPAIAAPAEPVAVADLAQPAIADPVAPAAAADLAPPAVAAPAAPVAALDLAQPAIPAPIAVPVAPAVAASLARPAIAAPIEPAHAATADPAPRVAAPPIEAEPVDEDEWEWEIAVARARIAAQWTEEPTPPLTPRAAGSARWPAATPPADFHDDADVTPAQALAQRGEPSFKVAPLRLTQPGMTPKTVIPVPGLPAAADPVAALRSMSPVRTQRPSTPRARLTPKPPRAATRR